VHRARTTTRLVGVTHLTRPHGSFEIRKDMLAWIVSHTAALSGCGQTVHHAPPRLVSKAIVVHDRRVDDGNMSTGRMRAFVANLLCSYRQGAVRIGSTSARVKCVSGA
jgi:hypothetical protein